MLPGLVMLKPADVSHLGDIQYILTLLGHRIM